MPLFGKDAKTYFSVTALDADNTAADVTWVEVTNIQDLTDNFTSEEVDVTTRQTAASGWVATAQTIKNGEITFNMLMEPDDAFVQAMMAAFLSSGSIPVLDMTGSKDVAGTFGLAANFSVGMTFPKPVKGIQQANATLKVQSFPGMGNGIGMIWPMRFANSSLDVTQGNQTATHSLTATINQTTAGVLENKQTISTGGSTISFTGITAARMVQFVNLDAANYVDIGPDSSGLVGMWRLNPGEFVQGPLKPSTVIKAIAHTGNVVIGVTLLET